MSGLQRIAAATLAERLKSEPPLLLLDARRSEAFRRYPQGIAGAVPVLLDEPAAAGFANVAETRRFSTVFGTMSLYRAVKPDPV